MEEDTPEIPTPPVQKETNSENKIHFAVSRNILIIAVLCFLFIVVGAGAYTLGIRSQLSDTPSSEENPVEDISGDCFIGGCNTETCSDNPSQASVCVALPEHDCYHNAECTRQSNGECGWTQTEELKKCLEKARGAFSNTEGTCSDFSEEECKQNEACEPDYLWTDCYECEPTYLRCKDALPSPTQKAI